MQSLIFMKECFLSQAAETKCTHEHVATEPTSAGPTETSKYSL